MSDESDKEMVGSGLTSAEGPPSPARRHFTRAGLSAPVVLGSLVSKPVLGQSGPPYNCTVSGHVSGNLSRPGDVVCSTLGSSRTYWLGNPWPSQMGTKGTEPNNGCNFPAGQGLVRGTLFAGFGSGVVPGGLASAFFTSAGTGQCNLVDSGAISARASLLEVLALPATGEKFDLGRATVVSLCNYYHNTSRYPVTAHTIIAMFNATYNGGLYDVNGSVSWNRAQVLRYLTSLYPAG